MKAFESSQADAPVLAEPVRDAWDCYNPSIHDKRDKARAACEIDSTSQPGSRVLNKLKEDFRKLKKGEPGRRFIDHYRRHRKSESRRETGWKTAAYIAAAVVLLTIGALLSLVPGVPGIVLGIPAIGLLVARLKFFARFLDRAEIAARRMWDRIKGRSS